MKIADLHEDWNDEERQRKWLDLVLGNAGFTEHDLDAGTAQFCGTFALVLCRLVPGAVPVMVAPADEDGNQLGTDWRHVAVLYENGFFDVYGQTEEDHMIDSYIGHGMDDDGNRISGTVFEIDEATLIKYIGTDEKSYSRRWYRRWEEMVKAAMMKVAGLAR